MNTRKYIFSMALLLAVMAGCKKDMYTDTSFINSATSPAKLSVLFDITQDNTGLVTITPSGEGVASFDVDYGDGTTTIAKVAAGKNTQHTYAEGVYTVKITAHGITGKTAQTTQQLTVSFKAPENLKVTVGITGLTVNVSATADYETLFKVYYGDSTDVSPPPVHSFLEGQTATHNYPNAGVYVLKVVALSGGVATTEYLDTIKVGKQIDLPVSFDDPNYDYTLSDFGGNSSSIATDPANNNNKVMKVVKTNGAEVWAGTTIGTGLGFATPVALTTANSKMTVRVYSPAAGLDIKLKLEDHNDGTHAVETDVTTTVANAWETLTFDFNNQAAGTPAMNSAYTYDKASLFFDFGNAGSGKVFYADDLKFISLTQINLPVTFDDAGVNYAVTDFGNNITVDATDPTNNANKVKKTTKPSGAETWAGTTIGTPAGFATAVPVSSTNSKMTVRVYSPAAGLDIKLKLEDHNDGTHAVETDVTTTVANAWEILTFDFNNPASGTPAMNSAYTYDKASLFFDFNVAGNGKVFYWDDVKFVPGGSTVLGFPLDFESSTLNYAFTNFDGGAATVVSNPDASGINTSSKVVKMVKSAGQTWGGAYLTLDNPMDFSTKKTLKMKVYSPRVGAKVLLKVENLTDGNVNFQQEVATTTANAWEQLSFDYSTINTANSYQKVTIIFDNGTMGDGSANFTYYFDDISQN